MTFLALLLAVFPAAFGGASADELADRRRAFEQATESAARIAALEAIAALDQPAGSSREAAEALAGALEVEDYLTRARAVELLAGMHPEVALEALGRAASAQVHEEREVAEYVRKRSKEMTDIDPRKGSKDEVLAGLGVLSEVSTEIAEYLEGRRDLGKVRAALVPALAGLRDDLAVAALAELLGDTLGESIDPILGALIGMGSVNALQPVVKRFKLLERALSDGRKELTRLKRQKPRKKPSKIWADEVWQDKEHERITQQIVQKSAQLAQLETWGAKLASGLGTFAQLEGLARTPSKIKPASSWTSWLRRSRESLPAELGSLAGSRE